MYNIQYAGIFNLLLLLENYKVISWERFKSLTIKQLIKINFYMKLWCGIFFYFIYLDF